MKPVIIIAIAFVLLFPANVFAETFFPTYGWRVESTPTYCVIEPPTDIVSESQSQKTYQKSMASLWIYDRF